MPNNSDMVSIAKEKEKTELLNEIDNTIKSLCIAARQENALWTRIEVARVAAALAEARSKLV